MAGLEFSGVLYEAVAVALKHLMSKAKIPISVVSLAGIHTGISHYHASSVEALKNQTLLFDTVLDKMGVNPYHLPECVILLQQRSRVAMKITSTPYSFASQNIQNVFHNKETLLSEHTFLSNEILDRCSNKVPEGFQSIHSVLESFMF